MDNYVFTVDHSCLCISLSSLKLIDLLGSLAPKELFYLEVASLTILIKFKYILKTYAGYCFFNKDN